MEGDHAAVGGDSGAVARPLGFTARGVGRDPHCPFREECSRGDRRQHDDGEDKQNEGNGEDAVPARRKPPGRKPQAMDGSAGIRVGLDHDLRTSR